VNDSSKPIPSGLIAPDRALLVAALVYISLLALACAVPNAGGRVAGVGGCVGCSVICGLLALLPAQSFVQR
jgi:hypothetical protein